MNAEQREKVRVIVDAIAIIDGDLLRLKEIHVDLEAMALVLSARKEKLLKEAEAI